jgi:hypothetical protein
MPKMLKVVRAEILLALEIAEAPAAALEQFRVIAEDFEAVTPPYRLLPMSPDDVWVNTKSGKYWKPGSLYYGKTKRGEYLSEKEAVQKGYLPANGTGE